VLCAGGATRFVLQGAPGGNKLLAPLRGRPLVTWSLEHAIGAGLGVTIAVTGAADISAHVPVGTLVVENPLWEGGIASSLQAAVGEARRLGLEAVVVGLGDQPFVPPSAWRAVAAARAAIAVATYGGARRNPVKLSRLVWDDLPRTGDEGARVLMRQRPELVEEVACEGEPLDVDTAEDLERAAAWDGFLEC